MGKPAKGTSPLDGVDFPVGFDPGLGTLAIAFFGVGDLLTTAIGLSFQRPVEAGPVIAITIEHFGLPIVDPLKLLTLALTYLLWRHTPSPQAIGVPLGMATLGALVTLWNLSILVVVL